MATAPIGNGSPIVKQEPGSQASSQQQRQLDDLLAQEAALKAQREALQGVLAKKTVQKDAVSDDEFRTVQEKLAEYANETKDEPQCIPDSP